MRYASTRGAEAVSGLSAIRRGLAPDGGLYVPQEFPRLDWAGLAGASYPELAAAVIGPFLPELSSAELLGMTRAAYARFDTEEVVPLAHRGDLHFLQLWHGPTSAFKDLALTVLPHLLTSARERGAGDHADTPTGTAPGPRPGAGRSLVLTATSGDTGKAALAGFADVPGTEVVVLYPTEGVSHIQQLQMVTQAGGNVHVIGIEGNFDDAQRAVKTLLTDREFGELVRARGDELTSANSINLGRLLPQIAYYVHGYLRLVEAGAVRAGEPVDVAVPTGNFGNILAASYARECGLPIARLICASNDNRVLTDFFAQGSYDARRELVRTSSPSMDILVSSNLERFLWHQGGTERVAVAMRELATDGSFTWDALPDTLVAGAADEAAMARALRHAWSDGYLMDPHTAVAAAVVDDLGTERPTLVAETASPFKFAPAVLHALGEPVPDDGFVAFDTLAALTGHLGPAALGELRHAPVRHGQVARAAGVVEAVKEVLGG